MVPAISSSPPPGPGAAGVGPGPFVPGQSSGFAVMGKNSIITGLIAGAIGGGIGAVAAEVLKNPERTNASTQAGLRVETGIWMLIVGACIGFVLAAWPGITAQAWGKAWRDGGFGALAGGVAGFIGGYVAQWLFSAMLDDLDFTSQSEMENKLRLARMLAWGLLGAATGLGLGLRDGPKKALNGLLGGAIGGAVGGLIFEQIELSGTESTSGLQVRLLGMVATGIGIGLGIGIVDRLRRDAWLKLTSGPLNGREIILFKETTTVGSDNRCDVVLANDPSVSGQHASFTRAGRSATVMAMGPVTVNGAPVSGARAIANGDVVQVGATSITYEER
jgi:hypothetical protein